MRYVIYNKDTSALIRKTQYSDTGYETESAAKAARTRYIKKNPETVPGSTRPNALYIENIGVAASNEYYENIEKMVERTNAMSGKKFMESINTPFSCSPASENYWCS